MSETPNSTMKFKYDGETFDFDLGSFTWAEIEYIEGELDAPIAEVDWRFQRNLRVAFTVFIRRRRADFTGADFLAAIAADPDSIELVEKPEPAQVEPDADAPSQPDSASPSEPGDGPKGPALS